MLIVQICVACSKRSLCSGQALTFLSAPQGLPGPPGDKGENGDVGAMVSAAATLCFCVFYFCAVAAAVPESPPEFAIMKLNTEHLVLHFGIKSMCSQRSS